MSGKMNKVMQESSKQNSPVLCRKCG